MVQDGKRHNKSKKEANDMNANAAVRYCSPAESLKESLKEVRLMREGKKPKKKWKDFWKEIEQEEQKEK